MNLSNSNDFQYLVEIDDSNLIKPINFKIEILKKKNLSSRNRNKLLDILFFSKLTNNQLKEVINFMNDRIDQRDQKIIWRRLIKLSSDYNFDKNVYDGIINSKLTKKAKQKILDNF
jgi:hypothetical protein